MYGIHFDHHMFSIARDGELLLAAPIAAEIEAQNPEAALEVGDIALASSRRRPSEISLHHWRELGAQPDAARRVAMELHTHLKALGLAGGRLDAVIAVPADLDASALAALRGALSAAGVDARAFFDAATLMAASVAERERVVVLEAGWRSAVATRVAGGPSCTHEESFASDTASLLNTYDLWLIAIGAAMVKHTRFDPLLTAVTEQALFEQLPSLAARAATEGRVEAAVQAAEARFAVEVDAQMLGDAAQPFYRELARLARMARIAGESAALLLPAESRRWPGFLTRLLELERDGLIIAPAGLAAVAASLRSVDADPVPRLLRHAGRAAEHALAGEIEYVSSAAPSAGRALPVTHILYNGDSMRFPEPGLSIGTAEVAGSPHILVPRAATGVSRRHCSLRRDGAATLLVDHSRHGTWLNGTRVRERARVAPGDRIRIGTPGVEFTLISAAAFDGGVRS